MPRALGGPFQSKHKHFLFTFLFAQVEKAVRTRTHPSQVAKPESKQFMVAKGELDVFDGLCFPH